MTYQGFKDRFKKIILTRSSGIKFLVYNVAGNSFTLLLNLILPLLISSEGYGYFALLFSVFNLVAAIYTFGLDSTIIKFTVEFSGSKSILLASYFSWIKMAIITTLILLPILFIVSKYNLLQITFISLLITVFASILIAIQRITLSYYIGVASIKKYGFLFSINKVIQFVFIIGSAIFFRFEILLYLLPYLFLAQSILILFYLFITERALIFAKKPSNIEIARITKFTLPLTINTFGNFGYNYGFNVFISPFLSLSQLGVLNIFTQLSGIANMTLNAMNNGYLPKFYKNFADNSRKSIIKYFRYISQNALLIIVTVFISGAIYKQISYKSNNDYTFLTLSIYFIGMYFYAYKSIGSNILILKGNTMRTSMITVWTSILNLFVGIIFTNQFGFIGSIFSLTSGYILQTFAFNLITISIIRE